MPALASVDVQAVFGGCCNARDLGGHLTGERRRIPARRLFRSDAIPGAAIGVETAGHLATVIDLRSPSEVRSATTARRVHLPLDNPQHGMTADDWRSADAVAQRYLELLLDGEDSVVELLAVLTDPAAYPVAIHCTGGKDRTGIIAALLLALVGVRDDDIRADYALSGFGAARLVAGLQRRFGDRPEAIRPFLPAVLSTDPDNIGIFLDRLRVKFGSVEGYVAAIGMESAIGFFRTALLD
jgi:protein tyrosine/serine phosphatase